MRLALTPVLATLLVAALTLSACGRKGPLERPPAAKTATVEGGTAVDTTVERRNRPFILDGLLQ